MAKQNKLVFINRNAAIFNKLLESDSSVLEHYSDTISSLKRLQQEYKLIISGHNRTNFTNAKSTIESILQKEGIIISAWYNDKMSTSLKKAKQDFSIDLSSSWFIIDDIQDIDFDDNTKNRWLFLLTNIGAKQIKDLPLEVKVFHNLTEASDTILERTEKFKAFNYCSISEGAENILKGGLTAFPTETVYGLGADVFQPESIRKIFELKERPFFDPLISHISDKRMLKLLTDDINPIAEKLIESFWPGPLTIVFSKKNTVDKIVTGGNPTVAVRMPANPIALELIRAAGTPIAAPSANSFGKTSPTTAKHVIEQLGTKGYSIIDGGACRVGVESTVLSITGKIPVILRQGGLPQEEIEKIIGPVDTTLRPQLKNLESPGLLDSHYAPETPLIIRDTPPQYNNDQKTGFLIFGKQEVFSAGPIENLSISGNAEEAAVNLYAAIRRLDKLHLDRIIAFWLPDAGIGRAINDRLLKSSTKK